MKNLLTVLLTITALLVYGQDIKLVKDLTPGSESSAITIIRASGEKLLFRLNTTAGWDLMISDGTSAGTEVLHSFDTDDDFIRSFEQGAKVTLFISNGSHALGYEVDPVQNTVTQICNIQLDVWFDEVVLMKGDYYIKAGFYLIRLNIPANTYTLVASLGQLYGLAVYNDELYTLEGDFFDGLSLYKSDGTQGGTVRLKALSGTFVSGSKNPNFTEVNGKLVFTVYNDQEAGEDGLWVTDGTSSGTMHLEDLYKYESFDFDKGSVVLGNKLYFNAKPEDLGYGWLYVTDGTKAGTRRIDQSEDGLLPVRMTVYEGQVYFYSMIERRIYTTDGNTVSEVYNYPAITAQYGDEATLGDQLIAFNNKLYSFGWTNVNGNELWECGTGANDFKQYDFFPGQDGMAAEQVTAGDKYLFFIGNTTATGSELYIFDPNATNSSNAVNTIALTVSPNPTRDFIQLPDDIPAGIVEILDISGKSVLKRRNIDNTVDVSVLPTGIYGIRISVKQKTYVSKFIKI